GVSAQAATLDFVAEAAGNERGVADGTVIAMDGVNVKFSAGKNNEAPGPVNFAYFDDLSGGKPGGLGVCSFLDSNDQCTPSSDDNVSAGEWVKLAFDYAVELSGLVFGASDHGDINPNGTLKINGVGMTFAQASSMSFVGDEIKFKYGGGNAKQFYIRAATVSPVPVPAAGYLLIAGIGGLVAMKRRKKA
ncbi:MAG: VPLPA-CTERM sorting domain-containing protein, partial [Boseongicola sp.]|nr:VPLPA-CTERM sorting domain-containing protein [Boseongicola sp.]